MADITYQMDIKSWDSTQQKLITSFETKTVSFSEVFSDLADNVTVFFDYLGFEDEDGGFGALTVTEDGTAYLTHSACFFDEACEIYHFGFSKEEVAETESMCS